MPLSASQFPEKAQGVRAAGFMEEAAPALAIGAVLDFRMRLDWLER